MVSASSGNTTSSHPWSCAWCSSVEQALDDVLAGVVALDRPELRGADRRRLASRVRSFLGQLAAARASSTSAPAARSAGSVCSAGLWLMPPTRRHEDHRRPGTRGPASGRRGRRPTASAAPVRRARRRCARRGRPTRSSNATGSKRASERALDRDALGRARRSSTNAASAALGLGAARRRRCCAGRRSASRVAGDDVDEVRVQLERADGADLGPPSSPASSAHERGDLAPRRSPASWRSAIGVVPAWFDWPVIVTSCQEMPCTPVTAPMVTPSASSTGPCSMCSSTKACGDEPRARRGTDVADALELVAEARRRRCRRRRAPPRPPARRRRRG